VRLGIYADLLYWADGESVTTDQAFVEFVLALPPRVDELVVFGRLSPERLRAPYAVSRPAVRFVPLPYYANTRDVRHVAGALRRSVRTLVRELPRLDALWVFGPHPLALGFAGAARRRGTPVVLGVRQDFRGYIAHRLPSRRWVWALPVAAALDRGFRLAARRLPAVVVGDALAVRYAGGAPVLASVFSLVRREDVLPAVPARGGTERPELRVLSVGRLDPEKNPLLLAEILAGLVDRDPRWRLTVAGDGPLDADLARAADRLGVRDRLELLGHVTNGEELRAFYRASDAFLHVSLTEGLPQVLLEAQAAGVPIVATDVGGVAAALGFGLRGLLVPPRDAHAAVDALMRIAVDTELAARLATAGLEYVRAHTLEAELDRIAAFLRSSS